MSNTTHKDELLKLLLAGNVEEFNKKRSYNDNIDLTELDFKDSSLKGAKLCKADLSGSDLSEAELIEVDFTGSNLGSVNFAHSVLMDCCFAETTLEGSIFTACEFVNCDFSEAEFNGANICGADFTGSDLSLCENLMHTSYNKNTVWPSDECLPDNFEPEYESSFAELEDEPAFTEDEYS